VLIEINIRNFALIDDLRLEVASGFNALTGETGAGKSIIVDALGAALGERVGGEVVRTGARKCVVEAIFDVSGNPAAAELASHLGFDTDEGLLILSREITDQARSQCRVNGRPTTASVVRELTSALIDIHGQHEHQSLLSVPLHIDIYDAWVGEPVMSLREEAKRLHAELGELLREKSRLETDERERARLLDLYRFQLGEITAAELRPGEDEEIEIERNRLVNAEKLYTAAAEICGYLSGETGGALDAVGDASVLASRLAHVDNSMQEYADNLNSALFSLQESYSAIREYRDAIEASPERLEQIEERFDLIRTMKKKYGDTVPDVLRYEEELTAKLNSIEHAEDDSRELDARIGRIEEQLTSVSRELREARAGSIVEFQGGVERELAQLAMEKTCFVVSMVPVEPGPKGADALEFLISPNPGEPVRPLAKIASGGEMSRIMLALKTVTANPEVPTLVFDEVDAGIGGRTAQVLGDKLAKLAEKCQVFCVTHLPQVASRASQHYRVEKVVREGRSFVEVRALDADDRVGEIARMLSGRETSETAALHAREMLAIADNGDR